MPLAECLSRKVAGTLQPWYTDDLGGVGAASESDNATMTMLQLLKEKRNLILDSILNQANRGVPVGHRSPAHSQ